MVKSTKLSEQKDYVNYLLYGDGGTGKTTDLASLANLGRVLYVDAEAGLKRRPLEELGIKVDNIERLDFGEDGLSWKSLDDVFWSVKRDLDDDPDSWVGVLWDSGTEIYHALIDAIVSARVVKAEKTIRSGKSISELMADRFFVDRDNYGTMSEQLRQLMRRFRDLPCHFGAAFLERRDQDKETSVVHIGPSITPALQGDLIGWHDIVGNTGYDAADDLYLGTFRPVGVREGKDRYGVLPRTLVDPTFDRIVGYVSGELTAETDPRQKALEEEEESGPDEAAETGKIGQGAALARARAARRASRGAGKGA